ncbi:hypothetical protein [Actinopolymorpha alba]|uniref:hypothetical protein n=1 Tax=Actinopolymorpha alba TaxID=533267 RepID=UPI000367A0BF|nr:hypothetical protein [Actinopolymorpha alba]
MPSGSGSSPGRRGTGSALAFTTVVGVLALAGVVVGFAWARLAPRVEMVMTQIGPFPPTELEAGKLVAMDAWYAILAGGTGVVLGAVLGTIYLRRGISMVFALTVGSLLAAVLAFVVGDLVANGEIVLAWHPRAQPGDTLTTPLTLHAFGVLLVWPLAALAPVIPLAWLGWAGEESSASPVIHRPNSPDMGQESAVR